MTIDKSIKFFQKKDIGWLVSLYFPSKCLYTVDWKRIYICFNSNTLEAIGQNSFIWGNVKFKWEQNQEQKDQIRKYFAQHGYELCFICSWLIKRCNAQEISWWSIVKCKCKASKFRIVNRLVGRNWTCHVSVGYCNWRDIYGL